MQIVKELRKKYKADLYCYPQKEPKDIEHFLGLINEARQLFDILYFQEYNRLLKYVKGGGTSFYTPMKKKERRKKLRKINQRPIGFFIQIYQEDLGLDDKNS